MMQLETFEPPNELTEDTVQYWCRHSKELAKTQVSKALKFVRYDCIHYLGYDEEFGSKHTFVCLPLNTLESWPVPNLCGAKVLPKKSYPKDYNFSEYKIYKNSEGNFCCNCQAWQTKAMKGTIVPDGANCSHVLALFFSFKLKRFSHQEGMEEGQQLIDDFVGGERNG